MTAVSAASCGSMIILFMYFTVLSHSRLFHPIIFALTFPPLKFWDENGHLKRNRAKPKKIHFIFVPDQRGLSWCKNPLKPDPQEDELKT